MMENLTRILHEGLHSLVVANGEIHTFNGKGVADLYNLYVSSPSLLKGAEIADKIVGKGAAALMATAGVKSIYADVISVPALSLLANYTIRVTYSEKVDNIINRLGTGICPVETVCLDCASAEECIPKIEEFMKSKNI